MCQRFFSQATMMELNTPPSRLTLPASKLSDTCVRNVFRLKVENIPIKK